MTRKLLFIFLLLLILNFCSLYFLTNLKKNKNTYYFKLPEEKYIYQTENIELIDIDSFDFNNYFHILSLENCSYIYEINEELIKISFNDNDYNYNYSIIKQEIIEKTIYIENEIKTNVNSKEDINEAYFINEEDYFYVDNNELFFELNTDFNEIRTKIINNIHSNKRVSIDYKYLNSSNIGNYDITYSTIYEEILIKIIIF